MPDAMRVKGEDMKERRGMNGERQQPVRMRNAECGVRNERQQQRQRRDPSATLGVTAWHTARWQCRGTPRPT